MKSKLQKYQKLSVILRYLFVDIAGMTQTNYYILGSFSIREHRTISDLDINVDFHEFYKLQKVIDSGFGKLEIYNNQIRWKHDLTIEYNKITGENEKDFSIEAFQKIATEGFPNTEYSLSQLSTNGGLDIDENGHQFFNLSTLLKWKKSMGREKDLPDIELITKLLSMKIVKKKPKTQKKQK